MMRISARKLVNLQPDELFNILDGQFILVMDDGELVTNWKETIYSSYMWEFHRHYPAAPLLKSHHVQTTLKGKRSGSKTHLDLLGSTLWSIYDALSGNMREDDKLTFRYNLGYLAYQITGNLYCGLSYHCEDCVTSLDIVDFIDILDQPEVIQEYKNLDEVHQKIEEGQMKDSSKAAYETALENVNKVITSVLYNKEGVFGNPLSKLSRSKLINHGQTIQCLGPRSFVTDLDSVQFKTPIRRGFAQGFHQFYDSAIESRSAAKALIFSKTPLQDAEYFSRKLQFMVQAVENLHHVDCGTGRYLRWEVQGKRDDGTGMVYEGDLKRLAGKHYVGSDGNLRTIHATDTHLIGQKINLRSILFCQHPDPRGVCSVCYGALSDSVPPDSNLGHMNATFMTQKSSQSVLSVKHRDGSAAIESIVLNDDDRRFLMVGVDGNSYVLSPALKDYHVEMAIPRDKAPSITDVLDVNDVQKLKTSNITELSSFTLRVNTGKTEEDVTLEVGVNHRKASLTHAVLNHIKQIVVNGNWPIDDKGNYVFNMTGWDWTLPVLELPLKHFNMSDHSKDIADILESSVDQMVARDRLVQPEVVLRELFDLVNSRLEVNLAVIEVVQYGVMVTSAERQDYSLPKPWTESGLGVRAKTMTQRSLSVTMAYQGHSDVILSPDSYTNTNRPEHIFDPILCPREVIAAGTRNM
jgi:hypothetical protein